MRRNGRASLLHTFHSSSHKVSSTYSHKYLNAISLLTPMPELIKVPYMTHQYCKVLVSDVTCSIITVLRRPRPRRKRRRGSSVNWSPSMDVGQSRNYRDGPARFRNEGQTVRPSWIWTPDLSYLERQYDEPLIHLATLFWRLYRYDYKSLFPYKHKWRVRKQCCLISSLIAITLVKVKFLFARQCIYKTVIK